MAGGVCIIDRDGEAHVFATLDAAARTFFDGDFEEAHLLGDDVETRLRSLIASRAADDVADARHEAEERLMLRAGVRF